ncbi:hypothetical protein Lal_00048050 [Lupinus albus]|nr:hypothetical protein Lal_00048050 [Lupinus albus]
MDREDRLVGVRHPPRTARNISCTRRAWRNPPCRAAPRPASCASDARGGSARSRRRCGCAPLGVAHRLARPGRCRRDGAGEAGDGGALGAPGDLGHRLEIADGGDGEPGLDDVDAHRVEQFGDRQLLIEGHGRAGALLAVAQGGVEDQDAVAAAGDWVGLCSWSLPS